MDAVARHGLKASFMSDTLACRVFNRPDTKQCKANLKLFRKLTHFRSMFHFHPVLEDQKPTNLIFSE